MKALSATDPKHHLEAFSPYPEGFVHIAPGDIDMDGLGFQLDDIAVMANYFTFGSDSLSFMPQVVTTATDVKIPLPTPAATRSNIICP